MADAIDGRDRAHPRAYGETPEQAVERLADWLALA